MYERPTGAPDREHGNHAGFRPGFDPLARSGSYFEPNHYSRGDRIRNMVLAAVLLAYGSFGVYMDDLYIPGKRTRGIHLQGASAWLMYAALVCAAAVLFALVVDHYDRRRNEHHYQTFKRVATVVGWSFAGSALLWHLARYFAR